MELNKQLKPVLYIWKEEERDEDADEIVMHNRSVNIPALAQLHARSMQGDSGTRISPGRRAACEAKRAPYIGRWEIYSPNERFFDQVFAKGDDNTIDIDAFSYATYLPTSFTYKGQAYDQSFGDPKNFRILWYSSRMHRHFFDVIIRAKSLLRPAGGCDENN